MNETTKTILIKVKRVPRRHPNAAGEWVDLEVDEKEWSKQKPADRYHWLGALVDQAFFVVAFDLHAKERVGD